jgi:Rrf2 family protein
MKISTRTRYGLRAMADLASNYRGSPIQVREIAERQGISGRYLEHIMLALKKAGLGEHKRCRRRLPSYKGCLVHYGL